MLGLEGPNKCKKCNKPEGTDINEPIWVGCDSCDEYWVHLHCLEVIEQLRVLLSLENPDIKWQCPDCPVINQSSFDLHCDVCTLMMSLDDFSVYPITDAAKCGNLRCMHVMHLSCLPEALQLQYHNFRFFGNPQFFCNTCIQSEN